LARPIAQGVRRIGWKIEAEEDWGRWTVQTERSKQELLTIRLCTLAQFAICSAHNDRPTLPAALVSRWIGRLLVVRDHNGQQLAYVYFEDEPGRRSAAKLLSKDEARRIAANICEAAGVAAAISRDAFNETPWRMFDTPLDSGWYATGQTNQLAVLIGPCAHTIRDKDLSKGNKKARGWRCPRMAQATSRLRGGSPKDGSGENLETSTKRQKSCRFNC
jgi:hypothetical protein